MSDRKHLLEEPQLPEYLIDPNKPSSLEKMREELMARAQWEEIRDLAKAKRIPMDQFVGSLTRDELKTFEERAYIRALVTTSHIRGLTGRVQMSVAYKILKKNIHRTHGEFESFEEFLEAKLDPDDPFNTSNYEVKFLLELIQSFESKGKHGFADRLFANRGGYGRMVTAIPTLRRKQTALIVAQNAFTDTEKHISGKQSELRKERSNAQSRGEPERVLKQYDIQLKQLEKEKVTAAEEHKPIANRLQADLTATTAAAVELAGSAIQRAEIPAMLPKVAEVYLRKEGYNPEEVSPDYGNGHHAPQPKAKALSIHLNDKTIFVLEANARQSTLVTKFLSGMFDVSLAELDEAIRFLSKNKKKGA